MVSSARRCLLLLATFLLFVGISFAQSSSPASPDAQLKPNDAAPPLFTSTTQFVTIPVVVTGKDGQHITGLPKSAFRIEEQGHPRDTAVFEEVTSLAPSLQVRTAMPAQGHTNFIFGESRNWRVTAIVLDLVNTPYMDQQQARRQLISYLQKSISREEPMALFGLGRSGLKQLHPFTQDPAVLIAALHKLQGEVSTDEMTESSSSVATESTASLDNASVSQSADVISQFMQDAAATEAAFQQRNSIRTTLQAMDELAHAYQAIPGRKTLIWASAGFPFMLDDPQAFARMGTDMQERYQQTWRSLNAAGISVYTVDVSGLKGLAGVTRNFDAARSAAYINPGTNRTRASKPMTIQYDKDQQRQQSLRAFAEATGGVACVNSNDLEHCFARAVDDSRSYYMLGYYLPQDDQQTGWRKLKVKVDAPGAHVRAREGFFVGPVVKDSPQQRQHEIAEALQSSVEYTGIRMNVRELPADATDKKDGKQHCRFAVGMPARSITVDAHNANNVDMAIVAVAMDGHGKAVGEGESHLSGKLKQETAEKIRRSGAAVELGIDLPPGTYQLRFAARDNLGGELGSVAFAYDVK
jgi:VWFA-related protein